MPFYFTHFTFSSTSILLRFSLGNDLGATSKRRLALILVKLVLCTSQIEASTFPSRATPGHWDWLVQIPSPRGKKVVQMPHHLSSKTNFVFNQTLFTLFREKCAVLTPSNFFQRPFWKSYSLTKAKFYLVNPSNLAKTEKKLTGILRQNNRKIRFKFPPSFQGNVQIPHSPGTMHSQM